MTILFELTRKKNTIFSFYCQVSLFLYSRSCLERRPLIDLYYTKRNTETWKGRISISREENGYELRNAFRFRNAIGEEKENEQKNKIKWNRSDENMQLCNYTLCTEVIYIARTLVIINYCYCHRYRGRDQSVIFRSRVSIVETSDLWSGRLKKKSKRYNCLRHRSFCWNRS